MSCDCFSLQNAAELVAIIKNEEYFLREDDYTLNNPHVKIVKAAADAIERLLAENAKLKSAFDEAYAANEDLFAKLEAVKAERDVAMRTLFTKKCDNWEWRGADHFADVGKKETDDNGRAQEKDTLRNLQ